LVHTGRRASTVEKPKRSPLVVRGDVNGAGMSDVRATVPEVLGQVKVLSVLDIAVKLNIPLRAVPP